MHELLERMFPAFLKPYAGRIVLAVLGFIVAVLFMTLGFWRTVLIVGLTVVGYLLGKWADGALDTSRFAHSHR